MTPGANPGEHGYMARQLSKDRKQAVIDDRHCFHCILTKSTNAVAVLSEIQRWLYMSLALLSPNGILLIHKLLSQCAVASWGSLMSVTID